ncbi:MAG: hypothetical protein HPY78_09480 [Brevinematales bacterium]|nr:hypothetical protein [Brevinematales bacterium]
MKWFDRFATIFFVYSFVIISVLWYANNNKEIKYYNNLYDYNVKIVRLFLKETLIDFLNGVKDNNDFSILEAYKIFDKKFNYLYLLPEYVRNLFNYDFMSYYEPVRSDFTGFYYNHVIITNDFDKYYEKVVSNLYLWRSYDK